MINRWLIRIAFVGVMIGAGAIAGAQEKAGGGAPPKAPAPPPAPPPRAPVNNPPPPAANPPRKEAPPAKPAPQPPAAIPAPQPPPRTPPQNNPAVNPVRQPMDRSNPTATDRRNTADEQRDPRDRRNRQPATRPGPQMVIGAPWLNTWGPYNWWFSGSSYWWTPMDDYRDNYDNRYRDNNATSSIPAPSSTDSPTPTQVQAQSLNQLEGMPEYRQLMADLKKAQNEYEAASQRALEKVKSNPEYQALVKQRDQAQDKVEAVQASAKIPNPDRVTPAAEKKLDLSTKITRMEQDAIAADPQASAAKARMVDLNERLTAMRKQAQGAR